LKRTEGLSTFAIDLGETPVNGGPIRKLDIAIPKSMTATGIENSGKEPDTRIGFVIVALHAASLAGKSVNEFDQTIKVNATLFLFLESKDSHGAFQGSILYVTEYHVAREIGFFTSLGNRKPQMRFEFFIHTLS
jgi:hypothetical protein